MKKLPLLLTAMVATATFLPTGRAQAQASDDWKFGASIYIYLPSLSGETSLPVSGGGNVGAPAESVMSKLEGAFMGTFEGRRGQVGFFTDLMYVKFGDTKSATRDFTVGGADLPAGATASTDATLKGYLWTVGGDYLVANNHGTTMSVFLGARMLDVNMSFRWALSGNIGSIPLPDQAGSFYGSYINWDAVVGIRGRLALGDAGRWYIPYYLDVGTGQSRLTSVGVVGVGYSFSWGDIDVGYRYVNYDMKSGGFLHDLKLSGAQVSYSYHW